MVLTDAHKQQLSGYIYFLRQGNFCMAAHPQDQYLGQIPIRNRKELMPFICTLSYFYSTRPFAVESIYVHVGTDCHSLNMKFFVISAALYLLKLRYNTGEETRRASTEGYYSYPKFGTLGIPVPKTGIVPCQRIVLSFLPPPPWSTYCIILSVVSAHPEIR